MATKHAITGMLYQIRCVEMRCAQVQCKGTGITSARQHVHTYDIQCSTIKTQIRVNMSYQMFVANLLELCVCVCVCVCACACACVCVPLKVDPSKQLDFKISMEGYEQCQGCVVSLKEAGIILSMTVTSAEGRTLRLTVTSEVVGVSALKVS